MATAPAPAQAEGIAVGCDASNPRPYCVVQAATDGSPGHPHTATVACHEPRTAIIWPCSLDGVGWLGADGCYYRPMTFAELAPYPVLFPPPIPPARWYVGSCGDPYSRIWPVTKYRVFGTPPQITLIAQQAASLLQIPPPAVRLSPPVGQVLLVRVPVWMWVDQATFRLRRATAAVPGLAVTATATPTTVVWRTGDGATVTCTGRGTSWTPGTDPNAASPTCGHTFSRSSASVPGHTFTISATVTWRVTWIGGGTSGRVPDLATTTSIRVPVGEVQTVITH